MKVLSEKEKLQAKEEVIDEAPPVEFNDPRVLRQLDSTLAFLSEECKGEPTAREDTKIHRDGSHACVGTERQGVVLLPLPVATG